MIIKVLLILVLLSIAWISIDNLRVKRKVTRLIGKVERLAGVAKIKFSLPKEELPDELIIMHLENQIDKLEPLILLTENKEK